MPVPANNEELYSLIAKSGVLEEPRVKAYVDRLMANGEYSSDPIKLGELLVRDGLLTNFQAEQLLQGRWKRFFIGKYKVLERLGVGGMGQVFLCEHKLMKRRVALKVLPVAKAKDEATLQRFYREARAVASVDHPNIARAYDIDEDGDLHFLVMEFVDGTNLHDLVKRSGPLPWLRAAHYIYGAAVGLQHAHEMGLVHRDIKPANILVDRSGVVKLLDMGLARFFNPEEDDNLTKKYDENVLGTADFLAPEQAIDSSSVDIRADIYGLGCTFYFLLTGQPPFPEGSVAQKLLWHQTKKPQAVESFRTDVPPGLVAILEKMIAKQATNRFQNPAEMMASLVSWIQAPIGPPTEQELPKMSMAASGRVTGPNSMLSSPDLGLRVAPAATSPAPATDPIHVEPFQAHAETGQPEEPSPFDFSSFSSSPPPSPPVAVVPPPTAPPVVVAAPPPPPVKKPTPAVAAPIPVKKPSAVVPVKPTTAPGAVAKAVEAPKPVPTAKPAAIKPPPLLPAKAVAKPVEPPPPPAVEPETASPANIWESLSTNEELPVVKQPAKHQTITSDKRVSETPPSPELPPAEVTPEVNTDNDDFGNFTTKTPPKAVGKRAKKATPPKIPAPKERKATESSNKKPADKKIVLIGLIVGGVLILGGTIAALLVIFGSKPSTPTTAPETATTGDTTSARTFYLNNSGKLVPEGSKVIKSLSEIRAPKSGDTIYIMDSEFEFPQITLSKLKNVRIEATGDGGIAKWKYKFNKGGEVPPVLTIQNCEGITIRGLEIDVGSEANNAIVVLGTANSVQFEKVTLRNCKSTGFRLANVVNAFNTGVHMTDCRVAASASLQQALHLSNSGHLFVSNSRLEGNGKGQAILSDGTVDVLVRNSRLYKFEYGIRVEPLPTDQPLNLTVETSTIHSMANAGVRVVGTPGEKHKIALNSNYFVGCGEALNVPKDSKIVEQDNNGRQAATKPGNATPPVAEVKVAPALGANPEGPDDQFLKAKPRPNVNGRPVGYD